jgi:hypothetical protein
MNNAFSTVLVLNEAVKKVVADSSRLYLTSLNAMFLARQVGSQAAGFTTVTTELRRFSNAMNQRMGALRVRIYDLVRQVSELQKIDLAYRYLQGAETRTGHHIVGSHCTVNRRTRVAAELGVNRARFGADLANAQRLCTVGENLAVLAKVEAVGAGSDEAVKKLAYIADEVEEIVNRIQMALKDAEREVTDHGAQAA